MGNFVDGDVCLTSQTTLIIATKIEAIHSTAVLSTTKVHVVEATAESVLAVRNATVQATESTKTCVTNKFEKTRWWQSRQMRTILLSTTEIAEQTTVLLSTAQVAQKTTAALITTTKSATGQTISDSAKCLTQTS